MVGKSKMNDEKVFQGKLFRHNQSKSIKNTLIVVSVFEWMCTETCCCIWYPVMSQRALIKDSCSARWRLCPWFLASFQTCGRTMLFQVFQQEIVNSGLSMLHCFANNPKLLHWMKNKDVKMVKDGILKWSVTFSPQTAQRSKLNKRGHKVAGVFVWTRPDVWSELMLNSKDIKGFPIHYVSILQFHLQ